MEGDALTANSDGHTAGGGGHTAGGIQLPPGLTNLLFPEGMIGTDQDNGFKLADFLRQAPLSQGEIDQGRMELMCGIRLGGEVRVQVWQRVAGGVIGKPATIGDGRSGEKKWSGQNLSEAKRLERLHDFARESKERLQSALSQSTLNRTLGPA